MQNPTTSPRAGLYITKPGRWIYSSGLHSRARLLFDPSCCIYMYMRSAYTAKESSVRSRCDRNSVVQFDSDLCEDASKWDRDRTYFLALGSSSCLLIGAVGRSSVLYPLSLLFAPLDLIHDVIDFSRTVHSPLNNARRYADLEIIECPRHLSPLRIVSRAAKSQQDFRGITDT